MLQASFNCLELEQPDSQEGAEEEDAGKRARYRNVYYYLDGTPDFSDLQ